MEFKLNITMGQTITVVLLMLVAFAGGFFLNNPSEQQVSEYTGFTDKDLNVLGQLAYASGECERMGLIGAVLPQQTDANEIYGIKVCVEGGVEQ